jgi:PadR family transcriptional regulator, regulatory protein PadR
MISKELAAASSRPIVLSILTRGEDYGYSIIQRVREASGGEVEWSEGMLYPVLHRLERDGLIRSNWKQADGGRRRKYYRLTLTGKRSLKVDREQWVCVHKTLTRLWGAQPCSSLIMQ